MLVDLFASNKVKTRDLRWCASPTPTFQLSIPAKKNKQINELFITEITAYTNLLLFESMQRVFFKS